MVEELLALGSDFNKVGEDGKLVVHYAAMYNWKNVLKYIYEHECFDAVDHNGDTAFTIAVYKNHAQMALKFLQAGADATIMNKKGFSVIQSFSRNTLFDNLGDCHEDIGRLLGEQVARMRTVPGLVKQNIICSDISRGREKRPIICVNNVDDSPAPLSSTFIYCSSNIFDEVDELIKIKPLRSCNCNFTSSNTIFKNQISRESHTYCLNCPCSKPICWYNEKGLIPNVHMFENESGDDKMFTIRECGKRCKCAKHLCLNRVVGDGTKCTFMLFKTFGMGWGVKTVFDITKGQFVCEYVGEVITEKQSFQRTSDTYLFTLSLPCKRFLIDAEKFGNIARFVNHSCDPNMTAIKVFSDCWNSNMPRIAFFALRDIKPYEEVTIDYSDEYWKVKIKKIQCMCQSKKCRYRRYK